LIDAAWSAKPEQPRAHLGASEIGNSCARALWYNFRWCSDKEFPGRLLRLFDRGHAEEIRFIRDLRMIGVEVHDRDPSTGAQFKYATLGGHFAGSGDGLALGVPQAPKTPHILEFKTSALKPFEDLKKKGVLESKPVHYSQMQLYMHWQGFTRALYMVVNKNNDEIYSERVKYVPEIALGLIEKARFIIESSEPPKGISTNPGYFECKWCDHYKTCHQHKPARVSCRTCISSTPVTTDKGGWTCNHHGVDISTANQRKACPDHRFIPALLPHSQVVGGAQDTRRIDYKVIATDVEYSNGARGQTGYSSAELQDLEPALIGDPGINALREHFHGVVQTIKSPATIIPLRPSFNEEDIPF
jgi:ribosomal protein S27E